MAEEREWKRGAHRARLEAPDMLWMEYQGPVSYECCTWAVNLLRELAGQRPVILIVDLTGSTTVDPEGRRYASEHVDAEWFVAVIYIGARLIHRAAVKGITLVQYLRGMQAPTVYFASNEAEVRDTIARLRATQPA
jgi:hypothetical protein